MASNNSQDNTSNQQSPTHSKSVDEVSLQASLRAARASLEQCNSLLSFARSWLRSYQATQKRMNRRSDSSQSRRASIADRTDIDFLHQQWEDVTAGKIVPGAAAVLNGAVKTLAREAKQKVVSGSATNQEKNLAWTDVEQAADQCMRLAAEIKELIDGDASEMSG